MFGVGGGHEGTPSWSMEANSEVTWVRGRACAQQKELEGMTDRQTDRHTHTASII